MAKMLPVLLILLGTYLLIMFIDNLQGLNMFQSLYNIKQYFTVARGEDYFLLFSFIFFFLFLSIFTAIKNQQPPSS
ncbi:hypothetical protein CN689_15950 [Peribacillus butanolivorans]|uniref:Uncharacterized protein n=1 Tax=Peribacillus butanolivorans TaxID=421767 RepID=A0AAX0RRE5_9BACI|nr:hypothetical protein DTO10_16970 [Peribacillus butanolivorans]PEJ31689.1 hypothetical protein CN689_15950 [Peribacillus butanolivorans]